MNNQIEKNYHDAALEEIAKNLGCQKEDIIDIPFTGKIYTGPIENKLRTLCGQCMFNEDYTYGVDEKLIKADEIETAGKLDEATKLRKEAADLEKELSMGKIKDILDNIGVNLGYILELQKIITEKDLTPKQKSIIKLQSYIAICEGASTKFVDLIILMLYKTKLPHNKGCGYEEEIKLVHCYNKMMTGLLFKKLNFLKNNCFEEIANTIDRNLRNSIAHLSLRVDDDGTIRGTNPKPQLYKHVIIDTKPKNKRQRQLYKYVKYKKININKALKTQQLGLMYTRGMASLIQKIRQPSPIR
ncbi:MAG: hypothetical protein LBH62_09375 [Nitrososphaerota archaeon]|jgi:hypothetical protein|nr:hypothetical protein [Nitrososphaerota archaeon]